MTPRVVHPSRSVLRQLLEASTPEGVYETVLDAAQDRFFADSCAVAVDVAGSLEIVKTVGDPLPGTVDTRFGPALQVLDGVDRTGQSCLVDDCHQTRSATPETGSESVTNADFRSVVCAPLGEYGVVFATAAAPGEFSDADREWLDELGTYAGSALDRFISPYLGVDGLDGDAPGLGGDPGDVGTTTDRETEREQQRLAKHVADFRQLYTSANGLYAAETVEQCYGTTIEAALEILGFDGCTVIAPDDDREEFEVKATSETGDQEGGDRLLGTEDGVVGRVYRTKESVLLTDIGTGEEAEPTNDRIQSAVTVPVGEWGVLQVISTERAHLQEEDATKVELLATSMATAIERIERQDELEARMSQLERQNERLDQFVSIVSHDLRNPLSVGRGQLELATEECDSEHLAAVGNALGRMDEMIEQLLVLAREGEHLGEFGAVSLRSVVEDCWSTVETADASVSVETDRFIRADRERLKQLLENLLRNAIEHGDGMETITIGDTEGGFYVADDGPGIPADQREAVFEWGHSTDRTGTGYGLTIVRQIAEAHGWEVAVTDSASGGARFEITGVETVTD
ncbi:MAG: GAF domain-containing sensor histidine kinase [Halovenus sp.]